MTSSPDYRSICFRASREWWHPLYRRVVNSVLALFNLGAYNETLIDIVKSSEWANEFYNLVNEPELHAKGFFSCVDDKDNDVARAALMLLYELDPMLAFQLAKDFSTLENHRLSEVYVMLKTLDEEREKYYRPKP